MKKKIYTICLAVLLAMPTSAFSYFLDGTKLKEYSDSDELALSENVRPIDILNSGYYKGFVTGIMDAVDGSTLCFPQATTLAEPYSIVRTFLNSNPQRLHEPAKVLVIDALRPAFQCTGADSRP